MTSPNSDPVARAILRHMGDALLDELGPSIIFALFVDWRDGQPLSYLSNGDRADMVKALQEWLGKVGSGAPTLAMERGLVPPLEAKCAKLGKDMVEEDIDVVLFLFTNTDPDGGGETAWFTSMPRGRAIVEDWVKNGGWGL